MIRRQVHNYLSIALVIIILMAGVFVIAPLSQAAQEQDATATIAPTQPTATDLPASATPTPEALPVVAQYGLFEVGFTLPDTYENPYDPAVVSVVAEFHSPDGITSTVPGFFMRPFRDVCEGACTSEELVPDGSGEWYVRFTPSQPGHWTFRIEAHDEAGERVGRMILVLLEQAPTHAISHSKTTRPISRSAKTSVGRGRRWVESMPTNNGLMR